MTTDITELAQSLKEAAEKATPGEWRRASTQFNGITATPFMLGRKEAMIAGASEKRDAEFIALANPANILALVNALEKAQRHANLTEAERQAYLGLISKRDERIAELESRTVTVKMPKPHAHLIWIQAGHAPDDYWDDVAVSHSEKDRCCDGSERYPVYARWEIEEMLTAAGIKMEVE
ncbi:ead/Ea22-like family protein [Raoultella planticola]